MCHHRDWAALDERLAEAEPTEATDDAELEVEDEPTVEAEEPADRLPPIQPSD